MNRNNNGLFCFNPCIDEVFSLYQKYFWTGFVLDKTFVPYFQPMPRIESKLLNKTFCKSQLISVVQLFSPRIKSYVDRYHMFVGQYEFVYKGNLIKFAIDSSDSQEVGSPDILSWSDFYFKTNRFPQKRYSSKVYPLPNCNGFLTPDRVNYLRSLRGREKKYNFCYVTRLLGGYGGKVRKHVVDVFEQLVKVSGPNCLLAVFPRARLDSQFSRELKNRLDDLGVKYLTDGKEMPLHELWEKMAQSKFVILREGKHKSATWRIMDTLCLGSNIILDRDFKPAWVPPLIKNVHYESLELEQSQDGTFSQEAYKAIPGKLEKILLANESSMGNLENSEYFDRHASHKAVAEYIFQTITS